MTINRLAGVARSVLICAAAAALPINIALANGPEFSSETLFELHNDYTFDADDADAQINNTSLTVEAGAALDFGRGVSLEGAFVIEQLEDGAPGDDLFFESHGLYAEELKLVLTKDNLSGQFGKFNPGFGLAWDLAPGIYGTELAEEYELAEKIGFGVSYAFERDGRPTYTVSGNTFRTDTTFLSDSIGTSRGEATKGDGGPGNTDTLASWSATLDSERELRGGAFAWTLGYRSQKAGEVDTGASDETGYVGGATYTWSPAEGLEASMIAEVASFSNIDTSDDDAIYWTAGGTMVQGPWNLASSFTRRNVDLLTGGEMKGTLTQLTAGYTFNNGMTLDGGFRLTNEAGSKSSTFGLMLSYVLPYPK